VPEPPLAASGSTPVVEPEVTDVPEEVPPPLAEPLVPPADMPALAIEPA